MEAVLSHTGDDVRSYSLEYFGTREQEAIDLLARLATHLVPDDLPHRITLSRRATLVAPDVVTLEEDTIDGEDLSGFEEEGVADKDVVNGDEAFGTVSEGLDGSFLLLRVEFAELLLLLVVVEGTNEDDDEDGDGDGDSLDPVDGGLDTEVVGAASRGVGGRRGAKVLVETEGERDGSGDRQNDLWREYRVSYDRRMGCKCNSQEPCLGRRASRAARTTCQPSSASC